MTHPRTRMIVLLALVLALSLGQVTAHDAARTDDGPWPAMGMNIYAVSYYDNVVYFTDATRHASDWFSFTPESGEWRDDRDIPRTENGYPAQLEADQGARMIVFIENEAAPAGDYTLTATGSGMLGVYVGGEYDEFAISGDTRTTITVPERATTELWLEITATDPADPLRDIHLWLPGYDETSDAIFTPWVLDALQPFNPIRLMDWSWMNNTDIESWSQRAQMDWASWGGEEGDFGRGVPYEVQIDLANQTGKDFWLNVPHAADDDFVTQLATLFRERLDPDLRVWVEYSNETWNPLFSQSGWLHERALAVNEVEDHEDYYLYHHYGRRSAEVLRIFEDVFAEDADRIVGVVGGLSGWAYPAQAALAEIEAQAEMALVDALAIAPYIGNYEEDGSWNVDEVVAGMDFNNPTEDDYALIFAELNRAVDAIFSGDGEYAVGMRGNRDLAEQYDLALVAYEAGQHLTAYDLAGAGFEGTVDEVVGVYNLVNARPEMYDLYLRYLDAWVAFGGDTIVMFHLAGSWNEVETFGHMDTILQPLDEAHKFRALLDWLAARPS